SFRAGTPAFRLGTLHGAPHGSSAGSLVFRRANPRIGRFMLTLTLPSPSLSPFVELDTSAPPFPPSPVHPVPPGLRSCSLVRLVSILRIAWITVDDAFPPSNSFRAGKNAAWSGNLAATPRPRRPDFHHARWVSPRPPCTD